MKDPWEPHTSCRVCGSHDLWRYMDYGKQPLANHFLKTKDEPEEAFPLSLAFCPVCGLSQLLQVVNPDILYREEYAYQSGVSSAWTLHCKTLIESLPSAGEKTFLVDIGANDGTLLDQAAKSWSGVRLLGIEPCLRLVSKNPKWAGIPMMNEFWSFETATQMLIIHKQKADYLIAQNVLAHVHDLDDFMAGVRHALADDGVFIFEVPYAGRFLNECQFDTAYHEHLSYFLIGPLLKLLRKHELGIFRMEDLPHHGGSIQICCRKRAGTVVSPIQESGLYAPAFYEDFEARVEKIRDDLLSLMNQLRSSCVAGLGAAAKGTVLANYCGLTGNMVSYIVDDTPGKGGTFQPGTRIPVVSSARLKEDPPEYLLIFAWNHLSELIARYPAENYIVPNPLRVIRGKDLAR